MNPIPQYITDTLKRELAVLEGWATLEKCEILVDLVLTNKPNRILEIGVFGGKSVLALALAVKENRRGIVWGIDPWTKDAALEGEQDPANIAWWTKLDMEQIYLYFVNMVLKNGLTREIHWIRATAEESVGFFADGSIDLAHVDSNHSELVSCRQVRQWLPKLSENSVLILDDSDWPSQTKAIGLIKDAGFFTKSEHRIMNCGTPTQFTVFAKA